MRIKLNKDEKNIISKKLKEIGKSKELNNMIKNQLDNHEGIFV